MRPDWIRYGPWIVAGVLVGACSGDDAGSEAGATQTDTNESATSSTSGGTEATTSDSATSTTGSTTTMGSAEGSSSAESGPKLDVAMETGAGDKGAYERCNVDEDCMRGLSCEAVGFGKDLIISHCTTPCSDASDCPDYPGGQVGCLDSPINGDPLCAVVCVDGLCPEPLTCWNSQAEMAPCVPE